MALTGYFLVYRAGIAWIGVQVWLIGACTVTGAAAFFAFFYSFCAWQYREVWKSPAIMSESAPMPNHPPPEAAVFLQKYVRKNTRSSVSQTYQGEP